jgi:hypothetical protein
MDLKELCATIGVDPKEAETKLGDKAKTLFIGEGEFIPKSRFDEINNQVKDYKAQVTDRDTQIATLSKSVKGNEELTKQIADLQAQNTKATQDYEAQLHARDLEYGINTELLKANVKNAKAVKALLDSSKISVKDGTVTGLSEQIEAIKKSDSYLFNDTDPNSTPIPGIGKTIVNKQAGGSGKLDLSNPETVSQLNNAKPWNKFKK